MQQSIMLSSKLAFALAAITFCPCDVNASTLPLSDKGVQATVVSIAGQETRSARVVGRVTRADALEYCQRDPGGETRQYGGRLTIPQCTDQYLRSERGRTYAAFADCVARTLRSTYRQGNPYRAIRISQQSGYRDITWRSASGQIAENSTAGGGNTLTAQFELLCPSTVEVYRGPIRYPDFQGRDRNYRSCRTRIVEAMRDGPNFAG